MTSLLGVQNFSKPYFLYPDSKLDVLHINFDLLDENYPMVKFNLHFEDFNQTGLTSLGDKSD